MAVLILNKSVDKAVKKHYNKSTRRLANYGSPKKVSVKSNRSILQTGGYFFLWSSEYLMISSIRRAIDTINAAVVMISLYVSIIPIPPS